MFQDKLNKIIEFVTSPDFSDEVQKAKEEYGNRVGKVYEDDQSYEIRMSHFLEWYIFDRNLMGKNVTPLLEFIEIHKSDWDEKTFQSFMSLARNVHGVFQVKKIAKDHVLVFNYFDKVKYKVLEKQSPLIFRKKDLFEGRIILETWGNQFTGTYCFHPQASQKFIKKEVEKLIQGFKKNTNELKKLEKEKNRRKHELKRLNSKLRVCKKNIENALMEYKKNHLENFKQTLEVQSNVLIQSIFELDKNIHELKTVKIETEGEQAKKLLNTPFCLHEPEMGTFSAN